MPSSHTNPQVFPALLNLPAFSFVDETIGWLTGWCEVVAPEGYEDETGFHLAPTNAGSVRPPTNGPVWLGEHI